MHHLRTVSDIGTLERLEALFRRTLWLKRARRQQRLSPTLAGRVLALVFDAPSTRTRLSFEAGVTLLGGATTTVQTRDLQLSSGEPLRDAARVMGGYVDAMVIRAASHDVVDGFAQYADAPVINGMTDDDHPCQVLTDLFTIYERRERPFERVFAWAGGPGPMLRGWLRMAALTGLKLRVLRAAIRPQDEALVHEAGACVSVMESAELLLAGADVVLTAPSGAFGVPLCVNSTGLAGAAEDHLVLHSLPAQRGVEITDDVLEGRHSAAFQQASNRLPVQQAIVELVLDAS